MNVTVHEHGRGAAVQVFLSVAERDLLRNAARNAGRPAAELLQRAVSKVLIELDVDELGREIAAEDERLQHAMDEHYAHEPARDPEFR